MVNLIIDGVYLDMFGDETITLTKRAKDARELNNLFADYSNTFSLPASQTNNKIFKHFYNFDIESWKAFYREKGCSYIQIGDKGLFHLGENPLNLPVPEILGSICLELRLYAAGTNGKPCGKVEIAIKFKSLVCGKSPYTLDNKNHITELFA